MVNKSLPLFCGTLAQQTYLQGSILNGSTDKCELRYLAQHCQTHLNAAQMQTKSIQKYNYKIKNNLGGKHEKFKQQK